MDITTLHPDIIQTHILNRLDGPSLASAASANSHLRRLCTQHHPLWRDICATTWPSLSDPVAAAIIATFPNAHRAIFSDSFPSLHHRSPPNPIPTPPPKELISAVDLYYKDKPVFSGVITTETHKRWFLSSPLWVDLLDPNQVVPTPFKLEQSNQQQWLSHLQHNLALSWIIIDPTLKRAANLSSRRPVQACRHWLTEDLQLLYALPMETVQCLVKVTCSGKVGGAMHVREVSLFMEDTHGKHVMGSDAVVILQHALLNGKRTKTDPDQAIQSFHNFSIVKTQIRERKMRMHHAMDMLAMFIAFTLFLFLFMAFRL